MPKYNICLPLANTIQYLKLLCVVVCVRLGDKIDLQILTETIDFVEHKVNVLFIDSLRRNNRSEEVWSSVVRLIADH